MCRSDSARQRSFKAVAVDRVLTYCKREGVQLKTQDSLKRFLSLDDPPLRFRDPKQGAEPVLVA